MKVKLFLVKVLVVWLMAFNLQASEVKLITWEDLVPASQRAMLPKPNNGIINHDQIAQMQPNMSKDAPIVLALDKKTVTLSGFAVALEGDDNGITEFLLVPFKGACVHVPPPPSNQIVYVVTEKPMSPEFLYTAFTVTGVLHTTGVSNELADSGYSMEAQSIVEYVPPAN